VVGALGRLVDPLDERDLSLGLDAVLTDASLRGTSLALPRMREALRRESVRGSGGGTRSAEGISAS
jgi:hypothetical protein